MASPAQSLANCRRRQTVIMPPDQVTPDYDDVWAELLTPPDVRQALADLGVDPSREASHA